MQIYFPSWLALYGAWNLVGFILIMVDKRRARRGEWRIRERTFFLWALVLGAAGILLGMYVFRHKTRQRSFVIGMPVIYAFNLICAYLLWR